MDTATYQVSSNGRRRFILLRFIIFIKRYTLFCFPYKLLFHVRSFVYNSLGFTCYNNFWKINVAMHFVNKNALHFFPSSVRIIISVDDFLLSSSRIARWIYRNGNKLTSTEGSSPLRPKSEILRAWEKREIIFSERIISH